MPALGQTTAPTASAADLIPTAEAYVKDYMSRYDASHDWSHIQRVVALAKTIYARETATGLPLPTVIAQDHCNGTPITNGWQKADQALAWELVHLAALMHDVGDAKYAKPGEYASTLPVHDLLVAWGASEQLAMRVQKVVRNVSYSHEKKNPEEVQSALEMFPELAIVQDADRLDAIGAVGIGRTFTFSGAKRPSEGMDGTIQHFHDKLERIKDMMKTRAGRELAEERTQRLVTFRAWWAEETREPEETAQTSPVAQDA